jgi:spore coat polysaccharide biosynthesis protein SpsF (cytidylyltransferase family)
MRIVAIIQARMGSSRLPGKVLLPIEGRSMLQWVCRRARQAALVDQVVVATTRQACDDVVADECRRLGVACFRGVEDDVLDRYCRAAEAHRADLVVRITADCPLIDAELIDDVVVAALQHEPDYASNVLRRTYPRGLDTEVATAAALARAWREAREPYQRVHVMPYFYQHPELFRLHSVTGDEDLSGHRWTVDSPEDLEFVRGVCRRLAGADAFSWRDVLRLVEREPGLADVNRHVRQKQLVDG